MCSISLLDLLSHKVVNLVYEVKNVLYTESTKQTLKCQFCPPLGKQDRIDDTDAHSVDS